MSQESGTSRSETQNFYDRIADVHNLAMKVNGYRDSVARYLSSLEIDLGSDSLVLDAGSGTGIVTLAFHSTGFRPKKPSLSTFPSIRSKSHANNLRKTKTPMPKTFALCRAIFCSFPSQAKLLI